MTAATHPVAPHHLPSFITAPEDTDVLMVAMAVILLASVLGFGIFFLRLHTLPERIAHKSHKLQFEIVAVLGLIALFTHQHIFWVAGLLLALIEFPDIGSWLGRIAGSVERIADNQSNTKTPPETADADRDDATPAPQEVVGGRRDGSGESTIPKLVPANTGS
jgi:multisubunit Na+/H+ antiporter MnhF subunit